MKITKYKKYVNFNSVLFFFSLIAGWPCVFYLIGWLPNFQMNFVVLFVFALIAVAFKRRLQVPKIVRNFILFQVFVWLFYSIIHGLDTSYYTRIFYLALVYLILELQVHTKDRMLFLKTFNFWLVIQVAMGMLGFVLVLGGVLKPIFEFVEMDNRTGYFFGLFTTNTYSFHLVRVAGFFDEPGALACWGVWALLFNKLFFNNKRVEAILCVGLFTTISLAYFIQLIAYLLLFYQSSKKKTLSYVVACIGLLCVLSSINSDLNDATFGRMQYDKSTGTIEGDNRTELVENSKIIFRSYPIFGAGARNLQNIAYRKGVFFGANAYTNLATDGLVGFIIVLVPLLYLYHLRKYWKELGYAIVVIAIGLLQRPYDSTQFLFPLIIYTLFLQSYLKIKRGNSISLNSVKKYEGITY
jgi:hypothetical protein